MSVEPTSFLYPFIDSEERGADALLRELAESARSKLEESTALRAATLERCEDQLRLAGQAMAKCFAAAGRVFAFGNGGSATDAENAVELFAHPHAGRSLPALSLVDNAAVLTALANDVGYDLVFARQLIAHGRSGDVALGFSTSGDSRNLLCAFEEAASRGMLTVGLCGYERAAMAQSDAVQHCLIVRSESVHRIQEAQDALLLRLWEIVQEEMATEGVGVP
jgi:D-sedoheptulose 7-phosphate isomerase